jgi:hypothetical protein
MDKAIRKVSVEPLQLLDVLQIINTKRSVDKNPAEKALMDTLIDALIDNLDSTCMPCTVELDQETRFAVWLCIDLYRQFCEETKQTVELENAKKLLTVFGG